MTQDCEGVKYYIVHRGGSGLIQVVGLYWKIIAYMAPLDPKLIRARLMDPEKVVGLCLQIVKVVGLKPHQPHRLCILYVQYAILHLW